MNEAAANMCLHLSGVCGFQLFLVGMKFSEGKLHQEHEKGVYIRDRMQVVHSAD